MLPAEMSPSLITRAVRRIRRQGTEPEFLTTPHFDLDNLGPDERATLATLTDADRMIVERALPYTMTGIRRLITLVDAVRYCIARDLPGAFAECGVWLGGSVMAMAVTLQDVGVADRPIHLYDTFEGMTAPTEHDTSGFNPSALELREQAER